MRPRDWRLKQEEIDAQTWPGSRLPQEQSLTSGFVRGVRFAEDRLAPLVKAAAMVEDAISVVYIPLRLSPYLDRLFAALAALKERR